MYSCGVEAYSHTFMPVKQILAAKFSNTVSALSHLILTRSKTGFHVTKDLRSCRRKLCQISAIAMSGMTPERRVGFVCSDRCMACRPCSRMNCTSDVQFRGWNEIATFIPNTVYDSLKLCNRKSFRIMRHSSGYIIGLYAAVKLPERLVGCVCLRRIGFTRAAGCSGQWSVWSVPLHPCVDS
jgi:hypothetical protein